MQLLNHFQSKPETIEKRFQLGKELRKKIPRIAQGEYKPAPDRADPVSILEEQGKTRLTDLVPIRYSRMLTSPFAFLRGAAAIMAADLAAGAPTAGRPVQCWCDMPGASLGVFAWADRNLIYGSNEFHVK